MLATQTLLAGTAPPAVATAAIIAEIPENLNIFNRLLLLIKNYIAILNKRA
jgi:hypothetical protein